MKKLIGLLSIIIFAVPLFAQETLKGTEEEYYDFLSLTGITVRPTLGYRTLSDNVWKFAEVPDVEGSNHVWENNNLGTTFTLWEPAAPATNWFADGLFQGLTARIYGPEWFNSYNTAAPYGQNDGALWQGRGYNTSLTAGLRLEGYGFELTFKPQVSFSENREFEYIPGVYGDTHSYFFNAGGIDLVQRFGDTSFWNFDWCDSEIRWSWHSLTLGFGTQNPWLGPAYLNPMLGSNNAGGYPKFDIGLRKTEVIIPGINLNLGSIEGRIWVGILKESDYFDNNPDNNDRMLTAMSASYQPSYIPGLTVGLNRIFMTYWRSENFKYIFRLFTATHSNALASSGNDEDQKISLFANWQFSKIGFEVFYEFGIDDYTSNRWSNPFHTAIYSLGLKQSIPIFFDLNSELILEFNNFEMSQDFQLEWPYQGYYSHGFVKQGYTNKGQILGAGTGFAGNNQLISYKIFFPKGYFNLFFHRYCPNNNFIYSKAVYNTAEKNKSDLNKEWYDRFETYFVYGGFIDYYINNSLFLDLGFSFISGYCVNYKKTGSYAYNFSIRLKYIF